MDLDRNAKYGYAHKQLRRKYQIQIDHAGSRGIPCARCSEPIVRGMKWDLGHRDGAGPRAYNGPEHIRCSRGTAGNGLANTQRNGNALPAAKPIPVIVEPELCEHRRRGEIHGLKCCGCSRDW